MHAVATQSHEAHHTRWACLRNDVAKILAVGLWASKLLKAWDAKVRAWKAWGRLGRVSAKILALRLWASELLKACHGQQKAQKDWGRLGASNR
jgi:hypothetical protein